MSAMDDGDLDGLIVELRALLLAERDPAAAAWLTIELTDSLADRYARRLTAGDHGAGTGPLTGWERRPRCSATCPPPAARGRPSSTSAATASWPARSRAAGEYDEALTPATAFLAAGAVTVVGARWNVPDDYTNLLMFMFHHLMTHRGLMPRDALRRAQLWMLDPARVPPPEMPASLAGRVRHSRLPQVTAWAAFVHQGR
jgi:hypothetical protein